jgi:hypothetical protein
MPGDPKECRLHAFHCAEMAANARTPQLKSALLEMSANWQRVARDLEAIQELWAADMPEREAWLLAVRLNKTEARPH